jgi:hypothetical protein
VRKRERYAQMSTRLNFINNLCKQYDSSQWLDILFDCGSTIRKRNKPGVRCVKIVQFS